MTTSKSAMMSVTFWGTRGSIPTPGIGTEKYGGNTACVSIRCRDTHIVIDAGTGIRDYGLHLVPQIAQRRRKPKLHLLLSHTHWDHIQGLPFFVPAYMPGIKLAVYGSPRKGNFLSSILAGQMDMNYFPIEMNALAADLSIEELSGESIKIGPVTVEWQEQSLHPGGSVRYRFTVGGRKVVYATDVELDVILGSAKDVKDKQQNRTMAREYSKFIHGADLLIADGQYTECEYETRVGWGHSSIPVLVDASYRACVKQLAVFHHEPQHSDAMLDKLGSDYASGYGTRKRPMNIFWAREGMTLPV